MAIALFLFVTLNWLYFVLRASFIIAFVFVWLKTITFTSFHWTVKPALLTCTIRLWYDADLKRDRTYFIVDRDSSQITEQILANCIIYSMSTALPLSFGQGSPFLVKLNALVLNVIGCWVDAFDLNLCWHISDTAVVVGYLSVSIYSVGFILVKIVLDPLKIRWVTRTFVKINWWWDPLIFSFFKKASAVDHCKLI